MKEKMKKIIDSRKIDGTIANLLNRNVFREYDWYSFYSDKIDNDNTMFDYAFKNLYEREIILLLEKSNRNALVNFLNDEERHYKPLLIGIVKKDYKQLFKYLNEVKEAPNFNNLNTDSIENWNKEPLYHAVLNKNDYFYNRFNGNTAFRSPKSFKDSIKANENLSFLTYFARNFDTEGIKFVLKNNLEDYTHNGKHPTVNNMFNHIKTSEEFSKNEKNIENIIDIIIEDYNRVENYYSLYSERNERIRSKSERGDKIVIKDVSSHIHPSIVLKLIEKMMDEYQPLLKLHLESMDSIVNHIAYKECDPDIEDDDVMMDIHAQYFYNYDIASKSYMKNLIIYKSDYILCNSLTKGYKIEDAIESCNEFINACIKDNPELLKGNYYLPLRKDIRIPENKKLYNINADLISISLLTNNENLFNLISDTSRRVMDKTSNGNIALLKDINRLPNFIYNLNENDKSIYKHDYFIIKEGKDYYSPLFNEEPNFNNEKMINKYLDFVFTNYRQLKLEAINFPKIIEDLSLPTDFFMIILEEKEKNFVDYIKSQKRKNPPAEALLEHIQPYKVEIEKITINDSLENENIVNNKIKRRL